MSIVNKSPSKVDLFIGAKIREARILSGFSLSKVAKRIDITFQQLQKYESGVNRIPAGRLYFVAKILRKNPDFFYPDIDCKKSFDD